MQYKPSETLKSRTFIGLLLAQFTATFNDQAIHMVAIFYASDILVRYIGSKTFDEKAVVSLVTACFITPFLMFSPFAGMLADKFSKRTIIVFWKVAEVAIMLLALFALSLPHLATAWGWNMESTATWSAFLVISCVLMMGLHSTFFVPAKYGAMPEILHTSVLSRGNGLLEGTSFMAQIFGTSLGGILYALLKSETENGVLEPGSEWMIGVLLLGLACLGTFTSFLMERIPVAAPDLKLTWNWWKPLRANFEILWASKPLMLAVLGISFAAFMTLFLRQTLLYEGEIRKEMHAAHRMAAETTETPPELPIARRHWPKFIPVKQLGSAAQQSELKVALLIALIGFGVGVGSLMAGYVSGDRVELGLVPIGSVFMTLLALFPIVMPQALLTIAICLFLIGVAAGLYIVPLYTLMQHRAPKKSKGNVVAASNFLNVVGGIIAVGLFFSLTFTLEKSFGLTLEPHEVAAHPERMQEYMGQLQKQMHIPRLQFLTLGLCTVAVLVLLMKRLPDFFVRTALWCHAWGKGRLHVGGLENLPGDRPLILATNVGQFHDIMHVVAATDRFTRVILLEPAATFDESHRILRHLARRAGMLSIRPESASPADWDKALQGGLAVLKSGDIVALTVDGPDASQQIETLLQAWQSATPAQVVPVYCSSNRPAETTAGQPPHAGSSVLIGLPLHPQATRADAVAGIQSLMQTGE